MSETPLIKKLLIKPGHRILVLNPPEGYIERLNPLPEGAALHTSPDGQFDFAQAFVRSQAEVNDLAPAAIQAVKPGGILWFAYPKKSSKVRTDIHRDAGWDVVTAAGWLGVTQIAIDDTWSALRFRPESEIKIITRKRL